MRPALAILRVSHSCGSQTDECATPARFHPRRRHGFFDVEVRLPRWPGSAREEHARAPHHTGRPQVPHSGPHRPLPWRHAPKAILFQVESRRPKPIGITHYTYSGAGRPHKLRVPAAAGPGNGVPVVSYGVLRNRLAYPKRDFRQRLTTWKKNGRRARWQRCAQQTSTHYGFALADARSNPALGLANGAFCGRPPSADRAKCEVSPHLPANTPGAASVAPSVALGGHGRLT